VAPNDRKFDHSTDTIATMLGAKAGPGLVMAAAAHMHFVNGKQVFTRKEIIAEMRTATGHIKKSYIANLSMHLKRLTGGIKARLRL
jgi:hypothetical protein